MNGFHFMVKICALLLIALLPSLSFSASTHTPIKLGCMMCHQSHSTHLTDSPKQHTQHTRKHQN